MAKATEDDRPRPGLSARKSSWPRTARAAFFSEQWAASLRSTYRKMILGFALSTALLAIFAGMASWSTYRLLQDDGWVTHTVEVLATLESISSQVSDAEANQRGYLLSGDAEFLRPIESARVVTLQRIDQLVQLVDDRPRTLATAEMLRPIVEDRFDLLERGIETRQRGGIDEVRQLVASGRGRARMNEIRGLITIMIHAERQLLDERVARSNLSARIAYFTYAALLAIVALLFWAVFRIVWRDILDRAIVQEELRQSRERFELAVRGSRDGIWDWDFVTNRTYYSRRWKEMLGYLDHEITDHPSEFTGRVHPDDRTRVESTLDAYLSGRLASYELEIRLRHKDGSDRWILTRGEALRDESGAPCRMAGSHTEITARKQAEAVKAEQSRRLEAAVVAERDAVSALKNAQSRLVESEKLAGLGQMVAGVAHEINNPLAFVINNAAVLSRDLKDIRRLVDLYDQARPTAGSTPTEAEVAAWHDVEAFRQEVDIAFTLDNLPRLVLRSEDGLRRIQQVVKDLRLFARLDEGDLQDADINAGVESTATIILGHARREDVRLVLNLGDIPRVSCFPARINQVVMNLLSNAVDATGRGGAVTVSTRLERGEVVVEVEDTGKGIDPAIRDRIFDPFFTTKPVGRGTGLGLSISYGIVQEHGGTIEVRSEVGRGTAFSVRLPIKSPLVALGHA